MLVINLRLHRMPNLKLYVIIVICFTAVCFKEILLSSPRRWRINSAEMWRSSVKLVRVNYRIMWLLVLDGLLAYKLLCLALGILC